MGEVCEGVDIVAYFRSHALIFHSYKNKISFDRYYLMDIIHTQNLQ